MEALARDLSRDGVERLELDRHTAFLAQWATRTDGCITATCFHPGPWSRSLAWLQRGVEAGRRLAARLRPAAGGRA
jgi:hypothetical protein